jgi:hypothetical protein
MENKLEDLSNNEILFQIKQMEADYEAIKINMLKLHDQMIEIEKNFDKAHRIITKRLKGE